MPLRLGKRCAMIPSACLLIFMRDAMRAARARLRRKQSAMLRHQHRMFYVLRARRRKRGTDEYAIPSARRRHRL